MRPRLEAGECDGADRLNALQLFASMRPRLEAGECKSPPPVTTPVRVLQ